MLTTKELADYLENITYKPGWEFSVYDGRWEGQHLVIRTEIPDSNPPHKPLVLDVHSMLPPMDNHQQFINWLMWRLARIEVHEMREWFKIRDRLVSDPHEEFADRDLG